MKTIVINVIPLHSGGGRTHISNLLAHFDTILDTQSEARVIAILSERFKPSRGFRNIQTLIPKFPSRSIIRRLLWEKFYVPYLLRSLKADVLFCPGGMLLGKNPVFCKRVISFTNILPFEPRARKRYPLGCQRLRLWLLRHLLLSSFKKADLVIFVSHYAREVISRLVPPEGKANVVILHGGIDDKFWHRPSLPFPDNLPKDYVLCV